jgi:hypothetical protein
MSQSQGGRRPHVWLNPSAFILHPCKPAASVEPRELVGLWVGEKWTTPQEVKTRFNDSRGSTEVTDVCMENVRRRRTAAFEHAVRKTS